MSHNRPETVASFCDSSSCILNYLNEERESDPLVVLGELPVFRQVLAAAIYSREGNIYSHFLEERTGYRVRGMNPAECVQYALWSVPMRTNTLVNRKTHGRKRSWPFSGTIQPLSWESEENHKNPQAGYPVSGTQFEPGTFRKINVRVPQLYKIITRSFGCILITATVSTVRVL